MEVHFGWQPWSTLASQEPSRSHRDFSQLSKCTELMRGSWHQKWIKTARAALPWLLPRVCLRSSSEFPEFLACIGHIGCRPIRGWACRSSCAVGHTGKQLSVFIRKVEILASGYVGLVYYWICPLITTVVFPIFKVMYLSKEYMPEI